MGIGKVSGASVSIVKKFSGSSEFVSISVGAPQEAGTHVFLLAGQSNMVGRPAFDGGTGYPSGSLQYPKATGYPTYTDTSTIAASPPLGHWDAQAGDMGLALQFTIDYVTNTGNTVVLIPAARGGTGFGTNNWNPGDVEYNHAVNATNALMTANSGWVFKGILWHQGENDSGNEAAYAVALYKMIQQMREDINEATQSTPFITGELLPGGNATTVSNTAVISNTPTYNYFSAKVSATSLTSYDNLHFDAASLRTFGARYEAVFSSLNNPYPTAETGAIGHWLFGRGNQLYIDLTGSATNLTENGTTPTFDYNNAALQGQADGLLSGITDSANLTMCIVYEYQNAGIILNGTLTPSPGTDGISMFQFGGDLRFNERNGTGNIVIETASNLTAANYYFAAVSIDSSDNYIGYLGDTTSATVVTGTGAGRTTSTRNLSVGDVHYNAATFGGAVTVCEAIFFDTAKTQSELDAIYTRSVARMSARNITVQ
jgi:hypothetical protein